MHRPKPSLILLGMILAATAARADIFQWEYVNPTDPSQGKQQSTTLCIDGAGVDAVPGANLSDRYLPMAYLDVADLRNAIGNHTNLYKASFVGANLSGAHFTRTSGGTVWESEVTNLTDADLGQANLSDATFAGAELTNADFTGAVIRGASFNVFVDFFGARYGGLTLAQLYSTASYQTYDLAGINLGGNNLYRGNFAHQNLTNSRFSFSSTGTAGAECCYSPPATLIDADFTAADVRGANLNGATLTGADFTAADVRGASFNKDDSYGTGITLAQLYSTASYQAHDLSGTGLGGNNLAGANFAGQDLTDAHFYAATMTGADFTGAEIRGANFGKYGSSGTGITLAQLYSTASYQAHDLSGVSLWGNNLAGANFDGQNLANASFGSAVLTGADFTAADVQSANFDYATLTGADFAGADVRGATFYKDEYYGGTGITLAQLYSTASYAAHDLSGILLSGNNLSGASFSGLNLTSANLNNANLTGADFTNAEVRAASFIDSTFSGLTLAQLYSTASYAAHDLSGIHLGRNQLSGANFAGYNLAGASFLGTNLAGADLSRANLSGARFSSAGSRGPNLSGANLSQANLTDALFIDANLQYADLSQANLTNAFYYYGSFGQLLEGADFTGADLRGGNFSFLLPFEEGAITTNLIYYNGHIDGLDLNGGGLLVVRDYDGDSRYDPPLLIPITVDQHFAMGAGGTLRMVFEADAWDSTISFAPGIPVTLGGTLELTFAADVNLTSQIGRTLKIFDWTGVNPAGAFAISTPYAWDLSNLYTTGEVTLTAIPEPPVFDLAALAVLGLVLTRRGQRSGDGS